MKVRGFYLAIAIVLLSSVMLCGCSGDDDDDTADDDAGDDDAGDDDDDDAADTQPPQFDGLKSAVSDEYGTIVLSWDAASDESAPVTYHVYLADAGGAQDFGNALVYSQDLSVYIPDLEVCRDWFFVVRATDAAGNQEQNTVEKSAVPVNYHCDIPWWKRLAWKFTAPNGPYNIDSLTWVHDVDDDGVDDVVMATSSAYGFEIGDTVFCISGDSGQAVWSAEPENESGYSPGGYGDKCLNRSPDLNGDGYDDVLFATVDDNRTAYALSGTDGSVLWYFDSWTNPDSPAHGWVHEIQPVPDTTGDGVAEATFCLGNDNNSGYLVNGATGDVLWRMDQANDDILSLVVIDDADDDQIPDVAFGVGDPLDTRVILVSGASEGTAEVIWAVDTECWNATMTSVADINEDGVREVVTGVWSTYTGPAKIVVLSGADGSVLWDYIGLGNYEPMRVVNAGNLTGDGFDDLVVASWANTVLAINGKTGAEMWREGTGTGGDMVWAVDAVGDVTGDGVADVAGGAFSATVYAMNGVSGDTLWSFDSGESKLFSVRGVPDLTGDCVPDVVAGTQALLSGDLGAGTVFLLEGCP